MYFLSGVSFFHFGQKIRLTKIYKIPVQTIQKLLNQTFKQRRNLLNHHK